MRPTGIDFGVLGTLRMAVDDRVVPLGAPKQRAVFAMLLLGRGRPVSVDALIDAVWEQSPAAAARTALHSYISNLRKILAESGMPRETLAAAPPGYRLDVPEDATDLGRFEKEKVAGVRAAAAGHFPSAAVHLSAALAQWRGPVLGDLSDFAFVDAVAAALVDERIVVETARAEAEIACGQAALVIGPLESLVAEHPYREPLWAQLITAYYSCGRQADALEAFRRVKSILAEDLGIDPGAAITTLQQRILRQEPLDVQGAAQETAVHTIGRLRSGSTRSTASRAGLRDASGQWFALRAMATRIGRLADNDIVLDAADVSRHHAVIVDAGSGPVMVDLRSANGVYVQGTRIEANTNLFDGDRIRIGAHEFTLELG
ncbi:BTAD domain-containing putative transcriptional regulator [Mycolicibacterium mucogenicum]|uniref:BTAD domain-containing putative transcriptional regulator n=1 Tax=Mycolicibacterium mucogenicum TaxID=56689 RepID=UPI002269F1AE|nr:BTAD domain-containing putative transcriptional regulator [Mycolicibacterium mucogenicum]MCX8557376.1 BTAD domain-containing putative transcriptional regulator [Mycolicibacterium mucogenicum]